MKVKFHNMILSKDRCKNHSVHFVLILSNEQQSMAIVCYKLVVQQIFSFFVIQQNNIHVCSLKYF